MLILLAFSGCATATPRTDAELRAVAEKVAVLKVEVPPQVSDACPRPELPSPKDALVLQKVQTFSLRQEENVLCERSRKDAAVDIILKMNQSVDDLRAALLKAVKDSKTSSASLLGSLL